MSMYGSMRLTPLRGKEQPLSVAHSVLPHAVHSVWGSTSQYRIRTSAPPLAPLLPIPTQCRWLVASSACVVVVVPSPPRVFTNLVEKDGRPIQKARRVARPTVLLHPWLSDDLTEDCQGCMFPSEAPQSLRRRSSHVAPQYRKSPNHHTPNPLG